MRINPAVLTAALGLAIAAALAAWHGLSAELLCLVVAAVAVVALLVALIGER
jgi:hypothetical protein